MKLKFLYVLSFVLIVVCTGNMHFQLKANNQQHEITFLEFLQLFDKPDVQIPNEFKRKFLPESFNIYDDLSYYSIKAIRPNNNDYYLILLQDVSSLCVHDYIISYSNEGKAIDMLLLSEFCDQDLGYYKYEYTDYSIDERDSVIIKQTVVEEFVSDSTLYDKYGILIDHIIEEVDTEVTKQIYQYKINLNGKFELSEN